MSGFTNSFPASADRKQTSWGRTRQAKNPQGQGKDVNSNRPNNAFSGTAVPTLETQGYATEGQRYLHFYYKRTINALLTVTLYGYSYAFGEWYIIGAGTGYLGSADGTGGGVGLSHLHGATSINISGTDRVYCQVSAEPHNNDDLMIAFNTFPI